MSAEVTSFIVVKTPLGVEVRTSAGYWSYMITVKHPVMKGKEDIVKTVLREPSEIRQSKTMKCFFITSSLIDYIA